MHSDAVSIIKTYSDCLKQITNIQQRVNHEHGHTVTLNVTFCPNNINLILLENNFSTISNLTY